MKISLVLALPATFIAGALTLYFFQAGSRIPPAATAPVSTSHLAVSARETDRTNSVALNLATIAELQSQLANLQDDVIAATAERDEIRAQFSALTTRLNEQVDERFLPGGNTDNAGQLSDSSSNRRQRPGNNRAASQYEELVAAGVDPAVAAEIRQAADQWELDRLDLIDRATREGWRRSDRFSSEIGALRDQQPDIRNTIGEQAYDAFLFAAGQNNRVSIDNVIDGSAARQAGIETGDIIISYDGAATFTTRELQSATRQGTRGETIAMVVFRNGQHLDLVIPRGPMGVTLSGLRQTPLQ